MYLLLSARASFFLNNNQTGQQDQQGLKAESGMMSKRNMTRSSWSVGVCSRPSRSFAFGCLGGLSLSKQMHRHLCGFSTSRPTIYPMQWLPVGSLTYDYYI